MYNICLCYILHPAVYPVICWFRKASILGLLSFLLFFLPFPRHPFHTHPTPSPFSVCVLFLLSCSHRSLPAAPPPTHITVHSPLCGEEKEEKGKGEVEAERERKRVCVSLSRTHTCSPHPRTLSHRTRTRRHTSNTSWNAFSFFCCTTLFFRFRSLSRSLRQIIRQHPEQQTAAPC